ncbi:PAS domain-containing sensor histidine kinase [Prolixibacteraceae bacterium JC049]|nr:PAS domain-containing sensor histidine kinase [Prolixibacteraceae bacterium JC049]
MSKEIEILKRKLDREKKARLEAENLLEQKATELFETNQQLESLVQQRTESLERNNNRLTTLIDSLSGGVLLEDEFRNIKLVNQQFCDMFSIPAPPEALVGMDCSNQAEQIKDIFTTPDVFVERIIVVLKEQKQVLNDILEMKDGRTLERDYIPIFSRNSYVGHLWHYRDITNRISFQNDLIEAQEKAIKAKETEKYFLAKMSHEIRTPLNAVIGMSHLLRDSALCKEQNEWLKTITASATLLQHLVNDILDLSKLESGMMELKVMPFNLKELVKTIEMGIVPLLQERVDLKTTLNDGVVDWYEGDPHVIQQILNNLLSNSAKFTTKGEVGLDVYKVAGNRIQFKVWDTGIGIPSEMHANIFDKYKQADSKHAAIGTGLGLNIVKELTTLLEGDIVLASEKGEGTAFTITIPLTETDAPIDYIEHPQEMKLDMQNIRIMVLEDNRFSIKYISKLLEGLGVKFDIAETVSDAYWLLDNNHYQMGLVDLNLPDGKGTEVVSFIRNQNNDMPLVALTASTLPDDISDAMESGVNDYLSKPFIPNELYAILGKYFEKMSATNSDHSEELELVNGLDAIQLKKLYGNDKNYMLDMFVGFKEDAMNTIIDFINNPPESLESIRYWVHKLKPNFGFVGLSEIEQEFDFIETEIDQKKMSLDVAIEKLNNLKVKLNNGMALVDKQIHVLNKND